MDIDYTCGHSRKSFTGDIVPTNCPDCGKGEFVRVRGVFTLSEKVDVKPLTRKEPLTGMGEKQFQMRVECPDHGLTIGQTFCFGCRERYRLIEQAQELINEHDPESTEDVLNLLYDAGMLRKAGDQ